MKGAHAIAATTAVLRHQLELGLARAQVAAALGGSAAVSALPPDRIATGGDERPLLNLFLYQVTPNLSSRRREGDGIAAFDLHYLLAAYGASDLHTELLLGQALEALRPLRALETGAFRRILGDALEGEALRELAPILTPLAMQDDGPVMQIEVAPQFLALEELSRLWSAFQARFRPSLALKIALVCR